MIPSFRNFLLPSGHAQPGDRLGASTQMQFRPAQPVPTQCVKTIRDIARMGKLLIKQKLWTD